MAAGGGTRRVALMLLAAAGPQARALLSVRGTGVRWSAFAPHARPARPHAPSPVMSDEPADWADGVDSLMASVAPDYGDDEGGEGGAELTGDPRRPFAPWFARLEPLPSSDVYEHDASADGRFGWRQNRDVTQLVWWVAPGTRSADLSVEIGAWRVRVTAHGEVLADAKLPAKISPSDSYWELSDPPAAADAQPAEQPAAEAEAVAEPPEGARCLLVELAKGPAFSHWPAPFISDEQ